MEWIHQYGIGFGLHDIEAMHSICTAEHMPDKVQRL